MDNLTIIDNELVPVYETDKRIKVVDGRELHSVLQSKQDFSTWVKRRLSECDAVENKDYELNHNFVEQISGTKHRIDYTILLDTAKEMAMLERNKKGKEVRRYFIRIEEKYKNQYRVPNTIAGQIQLLAQGHVELETKINEMKKDFEDFKNDMPILGIEETKISNAVKRKGVDCLGGKESVAYNNKSLRARLYSDLHKQLRREFGVSTYKAIKRNQTDTALAIIRGYNPPLVIFDQIQQDNAQMNMKDL